MKLVPPKGGTLTTTGATSPNAGDSRSLLESPCAVRRIAEKRKRLFFFFSFFRLTEKADR